MGFGQKVLKVRNAKLYGGDARGLLKGFQEYGFL